MVSVWRLEGEETVEENKKNLMILTQRVFDVIVASAERSEVLNISEFLSNLKKMIPRLSFFLR